MTSHIDIWENKEAYEYNRNWNGFGEAPAESLFSFVYDDFKWLADYINQHNKFWEIWEIFQLAAFAERECDTESWKGPHRDHANLKFFTDDVWNLTSLPIGTKCIGVFYND